PTSTPSPTSQPVAPTPTPSPTPTPAPPPPTPSPIPSITLLGGVSNLNGYCQSIGDSGASLDGNTAYNWSCVTPGGQHNGISMSAACQWQYNTSQTIPRLGNYSDPSSWQCWG
ncbi:MAG: hypothetical protein ACRDHW_22320, partial [Ktedonobacteraceae bacterium]